MESYLTGHNIAQISADRPLSEILIGLSAIRKVSAPKRDVLRLTARAPITGSQTCPDPGETVSAAPGSFLRPEKER